MTRLIDVLSTVSVSISIGLLVLFNLYYFFVILPALRRLGKSSFTKALFVWGRDIADMMKYAEIAKTGEEKQRLRTYRNIGIAFLISLPVTLLVFVLKIIFTKEI